MSGQRIEMIIGSADQPDGTRWEAQRKRIRDSGARFEPATRNWRLELDLAEPQRVAYALGSLMTAARHYGTRVLVLDPATGMPAISPLSGENASSSQS